MTALVLVLAAAAMGAACPPRPYLYVGSSVPAIEIFEVSPGSNGLPTLTRKAPGPTPSAGTPMAMAAIGNSLYVAAGGTSAQPAAIERFTIDRQTGALTAAGSAAAGGPPFKMAATTQTLYVSGFGSNDLRVYSVAASGALTGAQTVPVNGITNVEINDTGSLVFTGSRPSGGTGPQVCKFAAQANGTLGATPACVAVAGSPQDLEFADGVLYVLFNATVPPSLGNTNWVSAWTVDPTSGALTQRGTDLDIGAANVGGMALSVDRRTLYLPRQGGFTTVSTANPMSSAMVSFNTTGSQSCQLPPAGAGNVLVDPRGGAIYVTDPIGVASGNNIGPRVSELEIGANGSLTPVVCETAGKLPLSMAIAIP
jgi:6-phosphogluconolactonase (cycloisomerase 2 family)